VPGRRRPIARLKFPEDKVRKFVGVAGVSVALLAAACTGTEQSVDEGLKKDLELASTASPITLASSPNAAQVVSAIERTAPAPRRIAPSQRAVRHTPAPSPVQAPVEVEAADVSDEVEPAPVEIAEVPEEVAPVPSARPRPVESPGTGGGYGDIGGGRGESVGTIIGVVLRGGHAGVDDCDPRVDGRRGRGGHIAINNRIPVVGTFPGSGRLSSAIPRSGGGRVRF
jgi:hypothetical protein